MSSLLRIGTWAVLLLSACPALAGTLRLSSIFSDHMVLQQDFPVAVWGWAKPGTDVKVEFDGKVQSARADADGSWRATFEPLKANASPSALSVTSGDEQIRVNDVLVGEVWLCSGQSNMEWRLRDAAHGTDEVNAANWPQIRHIAAPRRTSSTPQTDIEAKWNICSPETAGDFTAVGYFFGRDLHRELHVPVGLVHCSWGGTRIEPWTPLEGFAGVPELHDLYITADTKRPGSDRYKAAAKSYLDEMSEWIDKSRQQIGQDAAIGEPPRFPDKLHPYSGPGDPTTLYNGMMRPFVPFTIRGAIWYQGEANHDEGMDYFTRTQALLRGWREQWQRPDLPFYFVQIAPWPYGDENPHILPRFWEAQAAIESRIDHTGMVVISDIGNLADIHPRNKQDVGARLANMALHRTYGHDEILDSGPRYKSHRAEGSKLLVTFDFAGGGLSARDDRPLTGFEICGHSTPWTTADVEIAAPDKVALTASGVDNPTGVRFAWDKLATPNLVNSAGLPAAPFRAGTPPDIDPLVLHAPETHDYQLVFDLDLSRLGEKIVYNVDRSAELKSPFDRVAYFVELIRKDGEHQWVYIATDPFTDDAKLTGIPTLASGAHFQQRLTNVVVRSNARGVPNGAGFEGNIEFWPNNYGRGNAADVPGASGNSYDTGDEIDANTVDGYGSMQIHIINPRETIFAINHWKDSRPDIGIGTNRRGGEPDWTFTGSADQYRQKRLRVLVRASQHANAGLHSAH